MAAQANLKSTAITNLDATPPVRATAGNEGGLTKLFDVVGIVGPTTSGATTGGVLRAVRIPSNAIVRSVQVAQQAGTTTASFDIGLYYSDAVDGTSSLNQAAAADDNCFGSGVDTHALTTWTEEAFGAGTYKVTDAVNPIWKLSTLVDGASNALTADPGGFFDVTLTNKATISGAATVAVRVQYVIAAI